MEKIKNIEFLRIIGCLAIILFHFFNIYFYKSFPDIEIYSKMNGMTSNACIAVDLFFILSGFFFFYKFSYTQSLWDFLKKKIIRLYPVLIFTLLLFFIVSFSGVLSFKFYNNILDLLFLNGTGIVKKSGNLGVIWYIGALMWSMIFYFYILKNYEKKNVNLIIALITFFCYEFMINVNNGEIGGNKSVFYNFINMGMLRALGGVGIAYFIAEWYKNNIDKIRSLSLTIKNKLLVTCLEFACLYFIINNLMLHNLKFGNDIIFIIVFVVTIMLFLIKQGYISKLLDKLCLNTVSKYTYSFYITHTLILKILRGSFWKTHSEWIYANPVENVVYTFIGILILGIFTYHFVEAPCAKYLSNKFGK